MDSLASDQPDVTEFEATVESVDEVVGLYE